MKPASNVKLEPFHWRVLARAPVVGRESMQLVQAMPRNLIVCSARPPRTRTPLAPSRAPTAQSARRRWRAAWVLHHAYKFACRAPQARQDPARYVQPASSRMTRVQMHAQLVQASAPLAKVQKSAHVMPDMKGRTVAHARRAQRASTRPRLAQESARSARAASIPVRLVHHPRMRVNHVLPGNSRL